MSPVLLDLCEALAEEWVCLKCLGELDDGYKCNDCGFDALAVIMPSSVEFKKKE